MPPRRDDNLGMRNFARQLRRSQTDAEAKLWFILRSRQLSGFKFRRQYPLIGYIVDFYCAREKLAVELDGDQHGDPEAELYDSLRTQRLNEIGVTVIRYSDREILKSPDAAAEDIYRRLLPSPQPSPGLPGEGESD
jgi:very-short-patch-repair endonuclease